MRYPANANLVDLKSQGPGAFVGLRELRPVGRGACPLRRPWSGRGPPPGLGDSSGMTAKVGSNVEIGQYLGSVALVHGRGSDQSCPDVLPTPLTSDICRCWCPSGCAVPGTAS